MICWSCEKDAGSGVLCQACAAIQPAEAGLDHFAVLGAQPRFDVDEVELERRYRELSRQVHPDRFARADARARRASLARSVQLNQAWKTLRDPVKRAEYLLSLQGIEVGGEEGTKRPAADGGQGAGARAPGPADGGAGAARGPAGSPRRRGPRPGRGAGRRRARPQGARPGGGGGGPAEPSPPELDVAARELVAVRYLDRFLDEVPAHESGDDASGGGGGPCRLRRCFRISEPGSLARQGGLRARRGAGGGHRPGHHQLAGGGGAGGRPDLPRRTPTGPTSSPRWCTTPPRAAWWSGAGPRTSWPC